jgi:hypothetical protein
MFNCQKICDEVLQFDDVINACTVALSIKNGLIHYFNYTPDLIYKIRFCSEKISTMNAVARDWD